MIPRPALLAAFRRHRSYHHSGEFEEKARQKLRRQAVEQRQLLLVHETQKGQGLSRRSKECRDDWGLLRVRQVLHA